MDGRVLAILGFLAVLTGVGAWFARRIRTAEDFALAGRGLSGPVLVGTLVATWVGTGSLFGHAEFTVENGVAGYLLPLAGGAGIVALSFLAPLARALPAETVPQILGLRFGAAARRLAAVTLIGAYLIIVSYQYRAGAAVLQMLFPGASHGWLVIGCAVFVTLFTALAGMFSVAFTDVVCGSVMVIGLLVAAALITGDFVAAGAELPARQLAPSGGMGWLGWLGVSLPAFLLILGDANMHQRFLSARSPPTARRAAIGMLFGVLAIDWAIVTIALFGGSMLAEPPANPGRTVIAVAMQLVPAGIGMLITAAAVSVIISTADSYLLATAVSAAGDLEARLRRPLVQRVLVVALGAAALGPAFMSDQFFRVAIYAYTLYGASLTPAVLLALLRPRTHPTIVLAGMAAGLAMAIVWKVLITFVELPASVTAIEAVIPALAANGMAMLLAALLIGRR